MVAPALEVLATRPSALITDIDGTISRIVPRPEDAVVTQRARQALAALARQLDLVAVVTAREEERARFMVQAEGIVYVGNYGHQANSDPMPDEESFRTVIASLRPLLRAIECVRLEDKGLGLAIHYRDCPDAEGIRARVLGLVLPLTEKGRVRVQEGKQVIELLPVSLPDKGAAVRALLESHKIAGAVYLGDDLSDIPVFRTLRQRREHSGLPSWGIAVIDAETDERVALAADQHLRGVTESEEFLVQLAAMLAGEGSGLNG